LPNRVFVISATTVLAVSQGCKSAGQDGGRTPIIAW